MSDVEDPINLNTAAELLSRKPDEPPPFATCPHDGEPLVGTFEFRGAEFYCVVCTRKYGFLAPTPAPPTAELEARLEVLQAQYDRERAARREDS